MNNNSSISSSGYNNLTPRSAGKQPVNSLRQSPRNTDLQILGSSNSSSGEHSSNSSGVGTSSITSSICGNGSGVNGSGITSSISGSGRTTTLDNTLVGETNGRNSSFNFADIRKRFIGSAVQKRNPVVK